MASLAGSTSMAALNRYGVSNDMLVSPLEFPLARRGPGVRVARCRRMPASAAPGGAEARQLVVEVDGRAGGLEPVAQVHALVLRVRVARGIADGRQQAGRVR